MKTKIPIIGVKKREVALRASIIVNIPRTKIEGKPKREILEEILSQIQIVASKIYKIALKKKAEWEAETIRGNGNKRKDN